jgi:DNA-binding transcriptional ArsR family regulator
MPKKARSRRGLVQSRGQLSVLASPVRQEIVDTVESLGGEAAVAEIAAQLGRPADGFYYHLRQLTRSGLLEELPESSDGKGRCYRTSAMRGQRLSLRYRGGSGGNSESVDRVVAGLLRVAKRDFSCALRSGEAVTEGPRRDLWASRAKGWVGAADLTEINRLLIRLNELLHQRRERHRDRLVSFAYVLAPVTARPLRRKS